MPRMSKIGALKIADPPKWKKAIITAMKEHGGRIPDAATSLEISARQLFRWLMLPEFKAVERIANGVPREGARRGKRKKPEPKVVDVKNIPTRKRKRTLPLDQPELADHDGGGAGED